MRINKSQLARELEVDRRTVEKYLNGYTPKRHRQRRSKLDDYHEIIAQLLSKESKQVFYYKRVLWQYLKDNHDLECAASTFRRYIQKKEEFRSYFQKNHRIRSNDAYSGIRYETPPGEQAQLDWKEDIRYETKSGEMISLQVAVLLLSHSRYRVCLMTISKSQNVLLSFLTEAFERLGGVPRVIITDNMKTVMDEPRTKYQDGRVNRGFAQFADDFGFRVQPCIAGRARTKGKVESPMKYLDEIHAYQGKLSIEELHAFVQTLCDRINHGYHQGTGVIPHLAWQKEKHSLKPLPRNSLRDAYKMEYTTVKVNQSSMVTYCSNQYSVPSKYRGRTVDIQELDNHLYIYDSTELLARHPITQKKLNYKEAHYKEALHATMPNYPDIDALAKKNLQAIGDMYRNE